MISKFLSIFQESTRSFEEQEKDEEVVLLLRRHPFVALLPVSTACTFALAPILIFAVFYSYIVDTYLTIFLFFTSLYYMILWIFAFYFLTMYTLNTVIVTNKRIIDRDQLGFFDRVVSELHLYRVQDITVSTKGVIPTILHYGDVIVQTAGVEQKFVFHEMPQPEKVRAAIMKVVSMTNSGVKPFTSEGDSVNNS